MRRIILSLLVIYLLPVSLNAGPKIPIVVVKGPSVIAFFSPVTEADLNKDDEANEALSDFQYYLQGAKPRLEKAGIKVHELYAKSFTVKLPSSTTTFKPQETEVGYYFISPGKKPRIQYGVMTDVDLLDVATEYFGKKIM